MNLLCSQCHLLNMRYKITIKTFSKAKSFQIIPKETAGLFLLRLCYYWMAFTSQLSHNCIYDF